MTLAAKAPPLPSPAADPALAADHGVGAAHARLMADRSLQFDLPAAAPPPEPPEWIKALGELLRAMGPALTWVFWIALALIVGLVLFLIARELGLIRLKPRSRPHQLSRDDWRPDADRARALLGDADALAAEGRFGEAIHLLLLRSIEDIGRFRPNSVRPALTARDIGAMEAMPDRARPIFQGIARMVERWLWAGQAVGAEDFARCRRDYEDFALGWSR